MRRPALLAILAALVAAVPASAGPLDDFRREGRIDPCRYSDRELRRELNGLPPDVEQYAPGLADQLLAGREGCGVRGRSEAVPGPGSVDARVRLADLASPPVTATANGSDAPGWLLPLLLALAAVTVPLTLARVRGDSAERVTRPLWASFADFGGRAADAFAELWDSIRLGR